MFHVEQKLRVFRLAILGSLCFLLTSCRSPDPNPELRDPIFQELKKAAAEAEKAHEDSKKAVEEAQAKLKEARPRTIEQKDAEKAYFKAIRATQSLKTAAHYLKIRSERRRIAARLSYEKAYNAHAEEKWPDRSEYSGYLTNQRLQQAPRKWSQRMKALREERAPANQSKEKGEAKEGEKEE